MGRKKRCIRLRLGRRAVIEVQFNWIFILIVGGLLMGFFFSIINKQKQAADMRLAQDTLAQIELIVAGARASKNLAGIIEPIPPLGITLSCDPTACSGHGCPSSFGVQGGGSKDMSTMVIAGPSLIKGSRLTTWTLPWEVPYWATNFLYLTSPEVRYIFVGNSQQMQALYDAMPATTTDDDGFDKVILSKEQLQWGGTGQPSSLQKALNSLQDTNNYKVRLVFDGHGVSATGTTSITVPAIGSAEISAVWIDWPTAAAAHPEDALHGKGTIKFYTYNAQSQMLSQTPVGTDYQYLGKASLFAAIIGDSPAMYECAMRKAIEQARLVAMVLGERASQINDYYQTSTNTVDARCKLLSGTPPNDGSYNVVKAKYDDIVALSPLSTSTTVTAMLTTLATKMTDIESANTQITSCPQVY